MMFRPINLRPSRGDPVGAYHAYLGEELTSTVTNWERIERILKTDCVDGGTLNHNSSNNISELARVNLSMLLP